MEVFGIVVVILLAVAAIAYSYWRKEQRKKTLLSWARQQGLSFNPARRYGLDEQYAEFKALWQGANRFCHNVLTGAWKSHEFLGFDYHYETHSTDSKGRRQTHHHYFSAVIVQSKIPLKPLHIRPEGVFDKIKDFFGYNDIDFESAEFSRKYHVSALDKRWAFDVLHARAIEYLLNQTRHTIQFDHSHIFVYRGGKLFAPEDFAGAADLAVGLVEMLPDYVVAQQTS